MNHIRFILFYHFEVLTNGITLGYPLSSLRGFNLGFRTRLSSIQHFEVLTQVSALGYPPSNILRF